MSCSSIKPDVSRSFPDIEIKKPLKTIKTEVQNIETISDDISKEVDKGIQQYPDISQFPVIKDHIYKIDMSLSTLQPSVYQLEPEFDKVIEVENDYNTLMRDKTELKKELTELKESNSFKAFGLMVLAGVGAIGLGAALAIFTNPKLGISVSVLGVVWVAVGRFFLAWAWIFDIVIVLTAVVTIVWLIWSYRSILMDFVISVNDTVDFKEEKEIQKKSKNSTFKKTEKLIGKKK